MTVQEMQTLIDQRAKNILILEETDNTIKATSPLFDDWFFIVDKHLLTCGQNPEYLIDILLNHPRMKFYDWIFNNFPGMKPLSELRKYCEQEDFIKQYQKNDMLRYLISSFGDK